MKQFYVYMYLREDRTPYYIGKGSGKRAWSNLNLDISHMSKVANKKRKYHKGYFCKFIEEK